MRSERYSDLVYRQLRDDILDWRLQPGDSLTEVEVAARLNVSRTPVREALQWLAREDLVRHSSGRGAVVADVSLDDVVSLFQMREALETYAARLAARSTRRAQFEDLRVEFERAGNRIDASPEDVSWYFELIDSMDDAINQVAGNSRLERALTETRNHIRRLRRLAQLNPTRLRSTAAEHRSICEAVAAGDETLAAQSTAVHIHNSLQNVLRELAQHALGSPATYGAVSAHPNAEESS